MSSRPQPGIFALGASEHSYLELDLVPAADPRELVVALASLPALLHGLDVVVALRPELWAAFEPTATTSFEPVGAGDFSMPASQHDAWVWIAAGARDLAFDATLATIDALSSVATVATETNGWVYRHDRDLTGFVDGTENPTSFEAPEVAAADDGSSVVLVQQWRHLQEWAGLAVADQERVIGRTKDASIELPADAMPADSHVARTVVEEDGEELEIYRRNTASGGPSDHGTMFVGFCATQRPLAVMLERMAGVGDGVRDALTRWTVPLTGAYYVAPSVESLLALLPEEDA